MLRRVAALLILPALAGCASIVSGRSQIVTMETPDAQEAHCQLQNHKGSWTVAATPSPVAIRDSSSDMVIVCEKEGYERTTSTFPSGLKPWLFGNVIFGGIIGLIVDLSDGAGFEYGDKFTVAMKKLEPPASSDPNATPPQGKDSSAPAVVKDAAKIM